MVRFTLQPLYPGEIAGRATEPVWTLWHKEFPALTGLLFVLEEKNYNE
jgi:hypothetical protein